MLISLEVNDNKAKLFVDFLNSIDFVKIVRSELDSEAHSDLLNERLEEYKNNPDSGIEAKEALQKLRVKYGF